MKWKIGFAGVGRMGANMARRLAETGETVAVIYDIDEAAAKILAEELGAEAAAHLAGITERAEIIFTVVSNDAAMEKIFFAPEDNLLKNSGGRIFINCATISPAMHTRVCEAAADAGADAVEACMASSVTQARAGTLYLMCGGERGAYEKIEPLLKKISVSRRFIGAAGEAAKVKALVNMVMNCNTAALAEGLGLGDALGLDLAMLREVFSQTGAASRVLETDGEDMQNREHDCYFSAEHAAKDCGIALDLASAEGLELPVAAATKKQYDRLVAKGHGQLDKSGIAELTFKNRRA